MGQHLSIFVPIIDAELSEYIKMSVNSASWPIKIIQIKMSVNSASWPIKIIQILVANLTESKQSYIFCKFFLETCVKYYLRLL